MNILWIEDDIYRIKGLLNPLEEQGARIFNAKNYKQAIESLNSGVKFDLFVVDLIIPNGNADELCEEREDKLDKTNDILGVNVCILCKNKYPDVPIVVITVVSDNVTIKKLMEIGVNRIFQKGSLFPSELKDELIDLIKEK